MLPNELLVTTAPVPDIFIGSVLDANVLYTCDVIVIVLVLPSVQSVYCHVGFGALNTALVAYDIHSGQYIVVVVVDGPT
jgi:hypothetical protein